MQDGYGIQGGHAITGYHSFELNYLAHLYIRAYVAKVEGQDESFCLSFRPRNCEGIKTFNVLPDFFRLEDLKIIGVKFNGIPQNIRDSSRFQIDIENIKPGAKIEVEFMPIRRETASEELRIRKEREGTVEMSYGTVGVIMKKILESKKIAVIAESKFIPEEMQAYRTGFGLYGAQVDFVSRIGHEDYKPNSVVFYSDVDPSDQEPWQSPENLTVEKDISTVTLDEYAAVIMSANYVSVRLRWSENTAFTDPRELVRSAPVSCFFAEAMKRQDIVKGVLCHGLWILTPYPELLKGRKVTCHTVVMADILNCGAEVVVKDADNGGKELAKVVVDEDLITGFSKHEALPFIEAIAGAIANRKRPRVHGD
ncbi:MAG: DJ-1/PfpI family protein [Treponema sp.]|nr:DJ-1/PfpI family protein [Treponema sp.]